jgi:integrase/recombinase XerD
MPLTDVTAEDAGFGIQATETVNLPDKYTTRELVGAFLKHKSSKVTDNTLRNYRQQLAKYHGWLKQRNDHILSVPGNRVPEFFADMDDAGYQPSSIEVTFDGVNAFYTTMSEKFGVEYRELPANPSSFEKDDIKQSLAGESLTESATGNGEQFHYVTKDQKDAMLDNVPRPTENIGLRNKLLIQFVWETGFRRSTVSNATVTQIDRDERRVTAYSPKAKDPSKPTHGRYVTATFSPAFGDLLSTYLDLGIRDSFYGAHSTDGLFLGREGPLKAQTIGAIVKDAADNAGIQTVLGTDTSGNDRHAVTAHTLRHGHAVHLLQQEDWTVEDVRRELYHTQIETTQRYLKQSREEHLRKQAESGLAAREESL